jgi:RNA polymerase sigma-70 factor (sigma-E family)
VDPYEGFREFVLARGPALSRTAYLLTGDHAAAEELVQSALVKTATHWRRVTSAGNPEAYVRRVMANERIGWWRRFGRREVPVADVPEGLGVDQSEASAGRIDLATALAQLPARQRAVIVLRFYEDMSEADAAATLGCSVGTVKSQTSAALAKLRRLIPAIVNDTTEVAR